MFGAGAAKTATQLLHTGCNDAAGTLVRALTQHRLAPCLLHALSGACGAGRQPGRPMATRVVSSGTSRLSHSQFGHHQPPGPRLCSWPAPEGSAVLGGMMDADLGGPGSMVGSAAWVGRVAGLRPADRAPQGPGFRGCPHSQSMTAEHGCWAQQALPIPHHQACTSTSITLACERQQVLTPNTALAGEVAALGCWAL